MTFLITLLHVIACLVLIIIVLLQAGKGASIGASMGGAGNQTLFGTTGATTILSKITTTVAIIFMVTSLYLAYYSGHRAGAGPAKSKSIMTKGAVNAGKPAPAANAPAAPVAPVTGIPVAPVPEKGAASGTKDTNTAAPAKPATPAGESKDSKTNPGSAK